MSSLKTYRIRGGTLTPVANGCSWARIDRSVAGVLAVSPRALLESGELVGGHGDPPALMRPPIPTSNAA
jgi:hypothetical protein